MTFEYIKQLSNENLYKLAFLLSIEYQLDTSSRADIEQLVWDYIQDIHDEQEAENVGPIRSQSERYENIEEYLYLLHVDKEKMPKRYNVTNIYVLLRDREWLYIFWNISVADSIRVLHNKLFVGLFLRVTCYFLQNNTKYFDRDNPDVVEDITITITDIQRYIAISHNNCAYIIALCANIGANSRVLVESQVLYIPAVSEALSAKIAEMYILSGITHIDKNYAIKMRTSNQI